MLESLDALSKKISAAFKERAQNFRKSSLFVKIVFVAFFSAVAGVAQFLQFPSTGATFPQILGIIASMIVAVGGIFVLVTEQDASSHLALAHEALEAARDAEAKYEVIDELQYEADLLIELYQAMSVMRGAIERVAFLSSPDENDVITNLLTAAGRSLAIAMDFQQADQWTIGVYKAVPDPKEVNRSLLKCVAHKRAIECEVTDARVWKEGTGIMGVAFANGDEIIIPDLQAEGMAAVFGAAGNESRIYDNDRYRSMVAVPIKVDGLDKPWGVVTATNDRVGHFSTKVPTGVRPEEGARALAGMVALAVAVLHSRNSQ